MKCNKQFKYSNYVAFSHFHGTAVNNSGQLLQSIERDGALQGLGKPEPLKYGKSGSFSRRIDEANRLVYEVSDNQIVVKSCKGHYDD